METFVFEVVDPISDLLLIEVWNKQFLLPDDPLGYIYIGLEKLEQGSEKDLWVELVNTDSGQVHITIMPINFTTNSLNSSSPSPEKPLIRVLSSPDDIIIHPNYNPNNPSAPLDISQAPFRYKDSKIAGGGGNYRLSPPEIITFSTSPPTQLHPLSSSLPSSTSTSPQSFNPINQHPPHNPFQYNQNNNNNNNIIITNNTPLYSNNNNNNNSFLNTTTNTNYNYNHNSPLTMTPSSSTLLTNPLQPLSTSPTNYNPPTSLMIITPQYPQYQQPPHITPSSPFTPFPPPSSINPPSIQSTDTHPTNQNDDDLLRVRKNNVRYKTRSGILEDTAISEGYKIEFDHLKFLNRIGAGGFGEVWKGEWNGTPVAIKHLIVQSESFSEKELLDFSNEILLMSKLRHPNIVQFLGATYKPQICLVTEFMERGNLHSALENKSIELTWAVRIQIALDAARGIFYLHSRSPPLIHRDIKSPNILLSRDWKATISDFGLTKIMQHYSSTEKLDDLNNNNNNSCEHLRSNRFGSPAWTAPEVLRNEPFSEKIDVYSYGIVLWEIITREVPYQNINDPLQLIGLVAYKKPSLRPPVPVDCPVVELVELMQQCWADDPSCRPNFKFIFEKLKTLLKKFN